LESGAVIDAVLADVLLPGGMNGLQLAHTLRDRFPALPVLLATGFGYAAEIAKIDGVRSIRKPFAAEQVTEVLAEMIAERARQRG
jgi:DNA-binding NtrC family response regulator